MIVIFAYKQYPEFWRKGEPPCKIQAKDIFEIKVDGDELTLIKSNLHRIPYSNNSQESYYGDLAKYISKAIGAAC